VQRIHDLAEDIELMLPIRSVADAYWRRSLVARKPLQLQLRQPPFARQAVHDLHLRWLSGHGADEPFPPCLCFIDIPTDHERVQRERNALTFRHGEIGDRVKVLAARGTTIRNCKLSGAAMAQIPSSVWRTQGTIQP
jgi:hypothetical protein